MAYQTLNPYTGEVVKTFTPHTDADVEQALAAGHALYKSEWAAPANMKARLQSLAKVADIMEARKEELARIISIDMGKLIGQSRNEIDSCVGIARYYAENGERLLAPVPYPDVLGEAWVEHHPIGILLAVEPWNFPLYQLIRVIAPAVAIGNPMVVKHASNVPQCAQAMEDVMREAGLPEGAYTNLFINPEQVAAIIADDRVQGVALTGSEYAGSIVAGQAGAKLKKSTMELGGNDVFVVLDDADVTRAAATAVGARLYNAGQVCTAAKRYIVQEGVAEEFTRLVVEHFNNVVMGDPLDENSTLAPLSSRRAKEDLQQQLDRAVANGAKLLCGGAAVPEKGEFFAPVLITDIERSNPAYFEEFFGPVAQLYVVKDDDAAVALANDSHYGLGGTIFSGDVERAKRLAARIETGMVFINQGSDSVGELPFGGVKRSGFGRELGDLGIKEFVNQKLVVVA
ncbi:succinate-semialdehyde dehydrogenase/glutarate-semialdehyde dehydrogenase [Neisseria sp. HSC-16F19]|nr:NAD-dependent succinate-semialdehyde dehydrogenase [Neisseria sp. HSC-16F19]MCP2040251.1 succinate-semialdehyde dehydrogenase/glutarate-semialdehyde dehydrogenase [Neisseria sp. HSC-16F19]